LQWFIWRDGQMLFHHIETEFGGEEMLRRFDEMGVIDEAWDTRIRNLLSPDPSDEADLFLVWRMDGDDQYAGNDLLGRTLAEEEPPAP